MPWMVKWMLCLMAWWQTVIGEDFNSLYNGFEKVLAMKQSAVNHKISLLWLQGLDWN